MQHCYDGDRPLVASLVRSLACTVNSHSMKVRCECSAGVNADVVNVVVQQWSVIQATGLPTLCTPQCSTVQILSCQLLWNSFLIAIAVWYGAHVLRSICYVM